jgi:hypothetical protein
VSAHDSEKRQTPRIQPYVAPCQVLDGEQRLSAYLTDLSPRGAQVFCDSRAPTPGSIITLEVRLGGRMSVSGLSAEVKWVREGGAGPGLSFGLTFKMLSAGQRELLERVIAEFRRRAAELA